MGTIIQEKKGILEQGGAELLHFQSGAEYLLYKFIQLKPYLKNWSPALQLVQTRGETTRKGEGC